MATVPVRSLSQFKTKLAGGGARPNLFEVVVNFPGIQGTPGNLNLNVQGDGGGWDNDAQDQFKFLCKAAALPASNVAPIDIPFRGRIMKVAGDRTFDTWTITVINDESFNIRRSFESWMQNVAQYGDHSGKTAPIDYMGQATVYQLGRADVITQDQITSPGEAKILAQYKFIDIFPTNIAQIDLSYDTSDTIEEFTVEFQVQYFYPEPAGSGS